MTEMSAGFELFRWQEFDSAGTRLLTEQGPRVRLKLSHNNEARLTDGVIYRVSGSLYGGNVEYDGQTQNPNAPKTESGYFSAANVDYTGASGEVMVGYRLSNLIWKRSLDLFMGVGLDSWTRDIGFGISSQGEKVGGFVEDFKIAYVRTGLGSMNREVFWKSRWRVGVKYPIFTKETVDVLAVELEPGKEASVFLTYRFQLVNGGSLDKGTFIYFAYDAYRFAKSPAVIAGKFIVHQPKSYMDVVSISLGCSF